MLRYCMRVRSLPPRLLCLILLVSLFPLLAAQEAPEAQSRRLAVLSLINQTPSAQNDVLARSVAQTISLALRLIGEFVIVEQPDRPTDEARDPATLAASQDLDLVLSGLVSETDEGTLRFLIEVYDAREGAVTVSEERAAASIFDTFDVADEITVAILSSLSGREIAFGSIVLPTDPRVSGPVGVFVDGQFVAAGVRRLDNIPAGERRIVIVQSTLRGAEAVILDQAVRIDADQALTLSYPDELQAPADSATAELLQPRLVSVREPRRSPASAGPAAERDWLRSGLLPERALWDRANPISALVTGMPRGLQPLLRDRQMVRAFSLPWQQPRVDWQVDGSSDDWPWYVPAKGLMETGQHPEIQVLSFRSSRSAEDILILIEFNDAGAEFMRERDPRLKFQIQAGWTYRFQVDQAGSSRWLVEGRAPSISPDFSTIANARAAVSGRFVELRFPAAFLEDPDSLSFMAVELERGNPNGPTENILSVPRSGEFFWGQP